MARGVMHDQDDAAPPEELEPREEEEAQDSEPDSKSAFFDEVLAEESEEPDASEGDQRIMPDAVAPGAGGWCSWCSSSF